MYTLPSKITDGVLASASVAGSGTMLDSLLQSSSADHNIWTVIIIPIVTGVIVPFLKDFLLKKRRKKAATTQTV